MYKIFIYSYLVKNPVLSYKLVKYYYYLVHTNYENIHNKTIKNIFVLFALKNIIYITVLLGLDHNKVKFFA